jgi:serpin B
VAVDEEGTEAAAATAVIMMRAAAVAPEEPVVFRADRPFLYLIRHRDTGAILFLGRMQDPRAEAGAAVK